MAMVMAVSHCLISIIDSEKSLYFNGGKFVKCKYFFIQNAGI